MIVDLTHLLNEDITVYPDTIGPKIDVLNTVENDGFAELRLTMVLHSGTHLDAPSHILRDGKSLDQFPIDKFTGKAVVIPCGGERELSLTFLRRFEASIAKAEFVLFFTGWQF